MFAVAGCIVYEHDLWLVAVAAIICAASSWATFQLYSRACLSVDIEREAWLILTSLVAGAGIWCTHFIAILGYDETMPMGFDPVLTIVSFLLAVLGVAAGFRISVAGRGRLIPVVGGAAVGLAIALMHYTGMQAYRVQGIVSWDRSYVAASILLSMVFSATALHVARRLGHRTRRLIAAALFALGIVLLHFTGMTAFKVEPMLIDPLMNADFGALRAMAFAVAGVAVVVVGAGLASTYIDYRARADTSHALNNMSSGLLLVAPDRTVRLFNERVIELFKLDAGDVSIGMPIDDFLTRVGERSGWTAHRLGRVLENYHSWFTTHETVTVDHLLDDGQVLEVCWQPMRNESTVITYDDVTDARTRQAEIAHMAFHDPLTGLPNRRSFRHDLETLSRERGRVLLMLDLDRFKHVNDTFGHAAGDALLVEVARRLKSLCAGSETIYRLGGDELSILTLRDMDSAVGLAQDVVSSLSNPFRIGGETISIGCSVGVACLGREADTGLVLQMADFALYKAKEYGRGRVHVYEQGMLEDAAHKRNLERDMDAALRLGQFELHYQPFYSLPDRRLTGFEALIRWRHPASGMIPPMDFIPIAEQNGAIIEIGAWVIDQACRQLSRWPDHVYVSVNVSPVQLRSPELLGQITRAMEQHGVQPHRIEIELTETAVVESSEQIVAVLSGLRALGVRIAMDDFGTGYSSLAYLKRFEFDRIKIDRSFIGVSEEDASAAAVVRAVTQLARDLSIATTAEGVESENQLKSLIAMGCGTAQGYLLSRPLTADKASALLEADGGATPQNALPLSDLSLKDASRPPALKRA
ncbi:bifunctional diguanylate cyclase/phosphodiesterase [Pseudohoeflea suaedae]|nr:EAL domain-containing protein [Pseudohoeflea suaedae]